MTTERRHPLPPAQRVTPTLVLTVDLAAARLVDAALTIGGEEHTARCPEDSRWRFLAPVVGLEGGLTITGHRSRDNHMMLCASRFLVSCLDEAGVHAVNMQFKAGAWTGTDVLNAVRMLLVLWWEHVTFAVSL